MGAQDAISTLDWVLCGLPSEQFFAANFEKAPLLQKTNDSGRFDHLLSLDAVEELISSTNLKHPHFRLVNEGEQTPVNQTVFDRRLAGNNERDIANLDIIYDGFLDGQTIVLQQLNMVWPPLARLCAGLEGEIGCGVQANAYLTPSTAGGLPVHYDTHDVFVLQVEGTKKWKVWPAQAYLPLRMQKEEYDRDVVAEFAKENQPSIEDVLTPGDALYIPRGFVHEARAEQTDSLHITVGLAVCRLADMVRMSLEQAISSAREVALFRDSLPLQARALENGDARTLKDRYAREVRKVLKSVTFDEAYALARLSFVESGTRNHEGRLLDLVDLETLPQTQRQVRTSIRPSKWHLSDSELHFFGQSYELTDTQCRIIGLINKKQEAELADLSNDTNSESFFADIRPLVKTGFLRLSVD